MGSLNRVNIKKGVVGPNAAAPDTSVCGLIGNWAVIASKFELNTLYKLQSLKDAEDLGISEAADVAADQVLHRHIADFYSFPQNENAVLYLLNAGNVTPTAMLEDTGMNAARKMLNEARGAIRQLGICYNVAAGSDPETLADGFNADCRAAIPKGQELYQWAFDNDMSCHIIIEGRRAADNLSTLADLRGLTVSGNPLECPQVSIVIGQDYDYAEARKNNSGAPANSKVQYHAAVGKALGTVAAAEINQSIAEVEAFNLTNIFKGEWLTAGISNHTKVADTAPAVIKNLDAKGFIFPIYYTDTAGLRWNGDGVCAPIKVDEEGNINEHTIYYSRTLNECVRVVKSALTPKLKKRVPVDAKTGKLPTGIRKNLEGYANEAFNNKLAKRGLIVAAETRIDPNSDLVTPPKSCLVNFRVVPTAILDNFSGTINLVKSFLI